MSELAYVTTYFDLPSPPHFVADFLQAKCDVTRKTSVLRFRAPIGGLGTTYDIHVRFIGKRVVNFPLVFIELFSLGVTAEALLAKIDRKSACGSVSAKFSRRRGRPPPIIFTRIVTPMNALQLCR